MGILGWSYPVLSVKQAGSPFEASARHAIETKTYDYIIVGGGAAGCCLASRLSEDSSVSVLVLERGPVNDVWYSENPMISSNIYEKALAPPVVWTPSMPVEGANGRVVDILQAEALGGGSRVNAMLVTRGPVGDFDHWATLGHPSWGYESLKPYFSKTEKSLSHKNSAWRGSSGPFVNQTATIFFDVQHNVRTAAAALGLHNVSDFNDPDVPVDVCTMLDEAIDENMRRVSSYTAFVPAKLAYERRQRLKICPKAVGTRIDFEDGVAVGVVFESSDKSIPGTFYAREEGRLFSAPERLPLLSCYFLGDHLNEHGIKPVVDLPGVGTHLQDHIGIPLEYEVPIQDSVHHLLNSTWKGLFEFAKYMLGFKGVLGSTITPVSIFAHSTHLDDKTAAVLDPLPSTGDRPDVELMTIAYAATDAHVVPPGVGVFSLLLCNLQPKSLGSVRLASADPHARPNVDLGFLSVAADYVPLRKGVRLARRLAAQVAAQGYPLKDFLLPASEEDKDVDEFIREEFRTCYHYSSSCRMARREEGGVVDDELRVYGVRGLRVCDASVFPCIPSAHTMIPTITFAERCADLMKAAAKVQ
ncbi:Alcohol oxidase [Mycena sanguinolenta]|uniref:Alcohol oxidase n=1 Tax=Mycena sanguinolenta TaxID=230812 RepID=A0A8H6Y369_9AGAR|nr:Alcohol oxidase [Mycena sanguinolenta]